MRPLDACLIIVLYKTIMVIDEGNFLYTITNIRQRLFKYLKRELNQAGIEGLAPSYGDILFILDQKGVIRQKEIARHTIKDKSTISSVIAKLESGGYLTKTKAGEDSRCTSLELTDKAKALKPILIEISQNMNARLFEGFSTKEKHTLFRLLGKVYKNL